jgi:hypothetical protein
MSRSVQSSYNLRNTAARRRYGQPNGFGGYNGHNGSNRFGGHNGYMRSMGSTECDEYPMQRQIYWGQHRSFDSVTSVDESSYDGSDIGDIPELDNRMIDVSMRRFRSKLGGSLLTLSMAVLYVVMAVTFSYCLMSTTISKYSNGDFQYQWWPRALKYEWWWSIVTYVVGGLTGLTSPGGTGTINPNMCSARQTL